MKTAHLLIGAAVLGVGGYLAWKYRGQIAGLTSPDPTVTTLAGSTYQGSQDIPGDAYNAFGTAASTPGSYDPTTSSPGANAALNGALDASGAGMSLGSLDA